MASQRCLKAEILEADNCYFVKVRLRHRGLFQAESEYTNAFKIKISKMRWRFQEVPKSRKSFPNILKSEFMSIH